jgi:hypothetical protein
MCHSVDKVWGVLGGVFCKFGLTGGWRSKMLPPSSGLEEAEDAWTVATET